MDQPIATVAGFDIRSGDPQVLLRRLQILAHRTHATPAEQAECAVMGHVLSKATGEAKFCAVCGRDLG